MACPSASWRSIAVLLFIANYCSFYPSPILVDAFAPTLPNSSRNIIASKVKISHRSYLQTQERKQSSEHQLQAINNDEEVSTDGVPSSPLDRPVLSAIDAVSLFVFAGVGKASHSAVDGSLDLVAVLVTAFPFLVSWFLVAPLVGSYTPEATKDIKSAAIQTAKAWALSVPLGCLLRGVIKGYVPPVPFVVVTLIATLVILTTGRVGYTFLSELYVEMF